MENGRGAVPRCFALLLAVCSLTPCAAQDPVITYLEPEALELGDEQAARLLSARREPTARTVRVARVDLGRLDSGEALALDVREPPVSLTAVSVTRRSPEDYSWFGDGPAGASAVLVVQGDGVTGTVRAGRDLYRIRPLGGGLHAVIEVDESAFPPDHPPDPEEPANHQGEPS